LTLLVSLLIRYFVCVYLFAGSSNGSGGRRPGFGLPGGYDVEDDSISGIKLFSFEYGIFLCIFCTMHVIVGS